MILARHRKPVIELKHVNLVKKDLVYIHIPKCAGTTICDFLDMTITRHTTYKQICNLLGDNIDQYNSFAFVRNPYDRFLSLYNYARQKKSLYHDNSIKGILWNKNHKDYKLLNHASLHDCIEYLEQGKLTHGRYWNHWHPQYTWVTDNNSVVKVDHIEKIENIDKGLYALTKAYDLNFRKIKFLNRSNSLSNMPQPVKERVYNFYKKDFELFEYEK